MTVMQNQKPVDTTILEQVNMLVKPSAVNFDDLAQMEYAVKYAIFPDSPTILYVYLDAIDMVAKRQSSSNRLVIYAGLLDTLLEIYSDDCLPLQWRELCLNHCYRPLAAMKKIAKTNHDKKYFRMQYQKFLIIGV